MAGRFHPYERRAVEGTRAPHVARTPEQIEVTFQRSIDKALSERICIVDVEHVSEFARRFHMSGSTGNLYKVLISRDEVSCDCPHGSQGATCKHILYNLIRKLRVPRISPLLKNKKLDENEWVCLFPPDVASSALIDADDTLRKAYELVQAQETKSDKDDESIDASERTQTGRVRAAFEEDSECPICCCEFDDGEETTWCRAQCGANLHAKCFDTWRSHKRERNEDVSCPYCRAAWWEACNNKANASTDEYVNLLTPSVNK